MHFLIIVCLPVLKYFQFILVEKVNKLESMFLLGR